MDDKTRNALSTLDLEPGSSLSDVKKSYRELALIWHPDKVPDRVKDRATVKFTQINDAYQWLLRNPDRLKVGASFSGSSQRRSPPRPSSASGYADDRSSRTQSSRTQSSRTGSSHSRSGDASDPAAQRIRQAARGLRTDPGAGIYIYPDVDADRAANFIVSLGNNAMFHGVAATVADLMVFYDIDGTGEEGMAITRSNCLVNNNAGTLYDIGGLEEVRLKEGFFFWSEIVVRRRGQRRFEPAGYAEKSPARAIVSILRNLIGNDRT